MRLQRSIKSKQLIDEYYQVSSSLVELMRNLLLQIKANLESENSNLDEKKDAKVGGNDGEEILNFDLTTRSNASQQLIKTQVMEELSPLRLVEVLHCSYAGGV